MATILIADDQAENRELLALLLRHSGHRLLQACDGIQTLKIAQLEHPDLIIADILMLRWMATTWCENCEPIHYSKLGFFFVVRYTLSQARADWRKPAV